MFPVDALRRIRPIIALRQDSLLCLHPFPFLAGGVPGQTVELWNRFIMDSTQSRFVSVNVVSSSVP